MSALVVKPRNRLAVKFSLPIKSVDWSDLDAPVARAQFNRTTNLLISALVLINSVCLLLGYLAVQISRKYHSAIGYSSDLKILKDENNFFNQIGGVIVLFSFVVFVLLIFWTRRLYESTSRLWLGNRDWGRRWAKWAWLLPYWYLFGLPFRAFNEPQSIKSIVGSSIFLLIPLFFTLLSPIRLLGEIDRMLRGNIIFFNADGPRLADGWRKETFSEALGIWFGFFALGMPIMAVSAISIRNPFLFESLEEGASHYAQVAKVVLAGCVFVALAGSSAIFFIQKTRKRVNERVFAQISSAIKLPHSELRVESNR